MFQRLLWISQILSYIYSRRCCGGGGEGDEGGDERVGQGERGGDGVYVFHFQAQFYNKDWLWVRNDGSKMEKSRRRKFQRGPRLLAARPGDFR